MSNGIAVYLTEEEIDYMFDAMDSEARHWEMCGASDQENARYRRAAQAYRDIGGKLQAALDRQEATDG
jgi:hypothetical protein